MQNLKQQRVGVTTELLTLIEARIKQLGIPSIPEYFRHLAINDVKNIVDNSIEVLDEETEKKLGKALEDYKKGRYTIITNKRQLDKLFRDI